MFEDEIYLGTKALLKRRNWIIIAGQPPSGCNHIPVVEIKHPDRMKLGSKGAYKPDLIAYKDGVFLIIECKPEYNSSDVEKLREILYSQERILLLYRELIQRNLLTRRGINRTQDEFLNNIRGAVAHSGEYRAISDLYVILISDISGDGEIIEPQDPTT